VAQRLAELDAKIAADAIILMDAENYPRKLTMFGRRRFDVANELTRWAAIAAAESDDCNLVSTVGISDGATRRTLRWFIDCANRERFNITEAQAVAARDRHAPGIADTARATALRLAVARPDSARWEDFNEANAAAACDLMTQNAMLVPRTFGTGFIRWAIDKNAETGIVIIERDFEAENAYGMEINGRYRCTIDTNSDRITGLSIREPSGWRELL
jgi:hypothetical protein